MCAQKQLYQGTETKDKPRADVVEVGYASSEQSVRNEFEEKQRGSGRYMYFVLMVSRPTPGLELKQCPSMHALYRACAWAHRPHNAGKEVACLLVHGPCPSPLTPPAGRNWTVGRNAWAGAPMCLVGHVQSVNGIKFVADLKISLGSSSNVQGETKKKKRKKPDQWPATVVLIIVHNKLLDRGPFRGARVSRCIAVAPCSTLKQAAL